MNQAEFDRAADAFATFHRFFWFLFGRWASSQRVAQYVRGLLVQQTDRRNAENIAEAVAGATPRALQRLLTDAPWATEPVINRLQAYLAPRLNTPEGVLVLDETGFPKKGTKSVGVARQYSGTLGKVSTCQLGVFIAYVSERGHALVDKRLYLPREWTDDPARRRAAGVPKDIIYQSKADLGLAMLRQSRAAGHLTGNWVTGDADDGKVPDLRDALDAEGWCYVLEVPATTPVFTEPAEVAVPAWSGRGPPPTRPRLLAGSPEPAAVREVAAGLPTESWPVVAVAEGAQGPRTYRFVAQRVWESRDGLPGRACWLVLRRNLDGTESKFFLSNAPAETPLLTLGQVGAQRWPIETEFQTQKGETGLDEYEVRGWAGWHHHITLALLAGAFLLTIQQDWGKKSAPIDAPASQPGTPRDPAPAHLDTRRAAGVADRHPTTQRERQTLARQTPPGQAA